MIESVRIESEEDGWHLVITADLHGPASRWQITDDGYRADHRLSPEAAEELLAQIEPVREYFAERDAARREYDAASPEERAAVLGLAPAHLDCGVDRGRIAEMRRVAADHQRKSERENP